MKRHGPWLLVLVLLGAAVAYVYLGPSVTFTLAARALIASLVYRLVRRAL